ncbi:MAG TPA: cyclase family protein [Clostridia bacterium]
MKFYDLSYTIGEVKKGALKEKISYTDHRTGADLLGLSLIFSPCKSLKNTIVDLIKFILGIRKVTRKDFPEGYGLSKETVSLSTHSSTHLDAPYHFGVSTEGAEAKTIDQVPLEWCYGEGVMLDFSGLKASGVKAIEKEHIESELKRIGATLKEGTIVLIKTSPQQKHKHLGMSKSATRYCVEKGVRIIGIDAVGFDRPFEDMLEDYIVSKDSSTLWPAHIYGREKEYCHIENLCLSEFNIQTGFKVCCFPVKVLNASAGWVRVVAMV